MSTLVEPRTLAIVLLLWLVVAQATGVIPVSAQPQPRVPVGEDWVLLEFRETQWYLRHKQITAVHAVSEEDAARLGHKTVIMGQGFKINTPLTHVEIVESIGIDPINKE